MKEKNSLKSALIIVATTIGGAAFLMFMALVVAFWLNPDSLKTAPVETARQSPPPPKPTPKTTPKPVEEPKRKFVEIGSTQSMPHLCYAAVDDAAWDALTEADSANDSIGMVNLLLTEKAFRLKEGDSVRVLDSGFTSLKVRALSGQGAGKAGWVYRECLEK